MSHFQFAQSEKAHSAGGNKSQIHLIRSYFLLSCQKYIHCKSLIESNTGGKSIHVNYNRHSAFTCQSLKIFSPFQYLHRHAMSFLKNDKERRKEGKKEKKEEGRKER